MSASDKPKPYHHTPALEQCDDGSVYIHAQSQTVFISGDEIPGLIADLAKSQANTLDRVLSEVNTAPIRRRKVR